jgi:hypothetical protein
MRLYLIRPLTLSLSPVGGGGPAAATCVAIANEIGCKDLVIILAEET